jgi:hypothetical protein
MKDLLDQALCLLKARRKAVVVPLAAVVTAAAVRLGFHLTDAEAFAIVTAVITLAVHQVKNVKCEDAPAE